MTLGNRPVSLPPHETAPLEDTRERTLPPERDLAVSPGRIHAEESVYLKQVALYRMAATYSDDKRVLDLGCGEGYGTDLVARTARQVVGADRSWEVVAHAATKYAGRNTCFVVCDAQRLPFRATSFQTVISFEVIEHVRDVSSYLREIQRVCAAGAPALLSTPNRLLRLLPFQRPWNRFHLREYDARGLESELRAVFRNVHLQGVIGTPEVMALEKRRVKQNPFIAYPRMIAQLALPPSLYDRLKPRRKERGPAVNGFSSEERISAEDYIISDRELRECITLVAVCR